MAAVFVKKPCPKKECPPTGGKCVLPKNNGKAWGLSPEGTPQKRDFAPKENLEGLPS